jgi:hypothetical protein
VFGVAGRLSDVDVLVPGVLVLVLDPEVPDDVSVSEVVEDSALVSGIGGAAAVSFGVGGAGAGAGAGAGVPDTAVVTCGFGLGFGGTGAVTAAGTGAGIPSIIFDGTIFPGVLPITGRGGALSGLQPGGKLPVSKPWKVLYPLAPTGVGLGMELKW